MSVSVQRGAELRGWHVLIAMIAFFAAVIAVNVAFAIVAVRSFPGEDVRRSYLQGLHYNDTLAERRAQAELGWRASAALDSASSRGADLIVALRDRAGAPLTALNVTGTLRWPADDKRDRPLSFIADANGQYRAHLDGLPPGQWRLRARASNTDGQALDFEADIAWPR